MNDLAPDKMCQIASKIWDTVSRDPEISIEEASKQFILMLLHTKLVAQCNPETREPSRCSSKSSPSIWMDRIDYLLETPSEYMEQAQGSRAPNEFLQRFLSQFFPNDPDNALILTTLNNIVRDVERDHSL
jgi:hypothetical protein